MIDNTMTPEEEQALDERMNTIARNGNDGAHYDAVDHPKHYMAHASGIECIEITEHMNFCLGNAVKYIWRADLKHNAIEDLRKAKWYIEREIELREGIARAAQSGMPAAMADTGIRSSGEMGAIPEEADNQGAA